MKSMLKSLMSVAVAALAFTSCSNDATEDVMPNVGSQTLKVNASIDQTRTTLDDNHVNLTWADGDQIHLYIGDKATKAIDYTIGGEQLKDVSYENGNTVYAYYSTKAGSSTGVTATQLNIPTGQNQKVANVFEGKNMPMVAQNQIVNGEVILTFKPIGCVLVFNVYGPAQNEKIKSIRFTSTETCGGYTPCDLTKDPVVYTPYKDTKSVAVNLPEGAYAPIVEAKPTEGTQKGSGNQVYLVVAQKNYTDGSFIVTTDAGEYTFTTKNGIDCSTSTARVVNLNLAKATTGFSPEIIAPAVPEQPADAVNNLLIDGITFKNISANQIATAEVAVYEDDALTQPIADPWIEFSGSTSATLVNGTLNCTLAANEGAERTAYIGIKCKEANGTVVAQVAIPVKQVGKGSTPAENVEVTYIPADMHSKDEVVSKETLEGVTLGFAEGTNTSGNVPTYYASDKTLRCYVNNTITVSSPDKISQIVITRGAKDDGKTLNLTSGGGTLSDNIWTGESNEVVLTPAGTIRIESMKITYIKGSGGGEQLAPTIEVPKVDQQSAEGGTFEIKNIVLKNIGETTVTAGVYSDAELTQPLGVGAWLTVDDSNLTSGNLSCVVATNETTESRTAYIGIKCAKGTEVVAQAAIAVTQKAQGAVEKYYVKVTENLEDWTGDYLIVYENSGTAYVWNLIDGNNGYISKNQSNLGILSDESTDDYKVTISQSQSGSGYLLYINAGVNSGKYIYLNTAEKGMTFGSKEEAEKYLNTITFETSSTPSYIKITSNGGYLQYNASQKRFRYYSSNQKKVQLYKLQK